MNNLKLHNDITGFFAEGHDIGTSGFYNNLAIDDDLGNVNSSIETGCNNHRQTDWVKDKPGQEAYFDKNVTSKDDPDLKGRIYVGKTFIELRENNFLYYGDEKGDLYQDPHPIFSFKKDTREPAEQGGGLGTASTIFGAVGVAGDVTSMSNSTFRLMSGANGTFSPKIYNSGWKGGSPARITTYSLSKVGTGVSTGASVVTTYMSYNQIYNGEAQPITYVDAGVGTAGILAAGASYFYGVQIPVVGEFVAVYGALRLTWDVSFYLGTKYGPSKWYGTNDNKWFK